MIWWNARRIDFLESVCNKINLSRETKNSVEECGELFDALNLTWNEFYIHRKNNGI
jgi:hypothetical protein